MNIIVTDPLAPTVVGGLTLRTHRPLSYIPLSAQIVVSIYTGDDGELKSHASFRDTTPLPPSLISLEGAISQAIQHLTATLADQPDHPIYCNEEEEEEEYHEDIPD